MIRILSSIRYVRFFPRNRAAMAKRILNIIFILLLVRSFPFISFSEEIYEFERMWPVLEQPWYFNWPHGVAFDSRGYIYVADSDNHRIQKFTSDGQFIAKWGSLGGGEGQFNWPGGVTVDGSGYVYVVDSGNHRIQKFTSSGQFIATWGSYGDEEGQFISPLGITVDSSDNVYVADTFNYRIQKFTSNGQFISQWGSKGTEEGQLDGPRGVAVDSNGYVYVADTYNHRIQKFTSYGEFIIKWGREGTGQGQLDGPRGVAVDSNGYVYVADTYNYRIQKFTSNGQFITKWGIEGSENGQFDYPSGIAMDNSGYVYVADTYNDRIQKFTLDGQFIAKWGNIGSGDGRFDYPSTITMDSNSNVYVADTDNHRIEKFTSNGQFIAKWGIEGSENGQFEYPSGITIDNDGNLYVADTDNDRIQKFTSEGQFITKWGSSGSGDGQFNSPIGIAVDSSGYVYVADTDNHRIQKFTSNGQFITKWGSSGSEDGQFNSPEDIAIDSSGKVYVADTDNHRIQKFTSNGQFIAKWGNIGSGDGQLNYPEGITVDSSGYVYVADTYNHRIQKFTSDGQFIAKWGGLGSFAGEFCYPLSLRVDLNGRVYVADSVNDRIQVFSKVTKPFKNKAIVVAGSGPYKGNNLWDATEMNANFAYRVLAYQGYTSETIYYLSSDRNIDLNGDGIPDVDGDATNIILQSAITQWAEDAENLVLYLTGHGGDGAFRMSETETLEAGDLASWLNELQQTMQGLVTVIYDACESGSFVSKLAPPSGTQRINISSTSPGETAYFLSQGALSFSYQFWSQIFGGAKIYDAFVMAKDVVGVAMGAGKSQNPQLDDNGNGVGNEKTDGDVARNNYIGKGIATTGDIPVISTISPDQRLSGQTSGTITVEVVSTGRITRVWAIVHSPDFSTTPGSPITDLPSFDLTWNEKNHRYEGTYSSFTVMGTYTVTVYAMNEAMIISLPKTTKIEQVTQADAPDISVTPLTYDFRNVKVKKSKSASFKVQNNGKADLLISTSIKGTDVSMFTITSGGGVSKTIKPGKTLTIKVSFKPTSAGSKSSTLEITSNDPDTPTIDIPLTATLPATTPDISVAQTTLDFGSIKVGKKVTKTLKITNNGSGDLVITLSGLEETDFGIQGSSSVTIKGKKSYSLKVVFTPTSAGSKTAKLEIHSNDPDTPTLEISMSGTGQ